MDKVKDFNELTWNVTEEEYRADPAISYSTLSTFAKKGIKGLKEIVDGVKFSSSSLRHGSLVDTILTDRDNFDNLYIVADYNKPTETIRVIVDSLWEHTLEIGYDKPLDDFSVDHTETMLNIINSHNYGGDNWRPQTKINKILEEGREYYELLALTKGDKELVHQEEFDLAEACVIEIYDNEYTSWLFDRSNGSELHFQSKFKITHNLKKDIYAWKDELLSDDTIRCMFDMIYIDHKRKVIIPIDLKTTSMNEEDFQGAFDMWHYDLQSGMYSYILRQVVAADDFYKDYVVLPFRFLPINKFHLNPQFFIDEESTQDMLNPYMDSKGYTHLPWQILLGQVRWHLNKKEFRYTMETVKGKGKSLLHRT